MRNGSGLTLLHEIRGPLHVEAIARSHCPALSPFSGLRRLQRPASIYDSGTFATEPNGVLNQPINNNRGSTSTPISGVSSIAPGNWFGNQHGDSFNQTGWYSTGPGTGTLYYSPNARSSVTQFVGLDVPIGNVTGITATVSTNASDEQAFALYIAPALGQPGTWYVSETTFDSDNTATSTLNLSGEFYTAAGAPIGPFNNDFSSSTSALPTTGILEAAGIFTNFTPNSGFVKIEDFVVYGTPAVPEPSTWAMIIVGFGALGLLRHRARRLKPQTA